MEWTVPGAIIDEELDPWDEYVLIDLKTGKVVLRVTDAEMESRCPECGLPHDPDAD